MITENQKDQVYFSNLFALHYSQLYKQISDILRQNGVVHSTLKHTKDYWCRDFMPVQIQDKQMIQFVYNPDYLKDNTKYITNTSLVLEKIADGSIKTEQSPLVIDGGNMVFCRSLQTEYVIMTDKVLHENPALSIQQIENELHCTLGGDIVIVWLPWDETDICGHTDGIVRYVGIGIEGQARVMVNLRVYSKSYANRVHHILSRHFDVIDIQLPEYDELSWAYINALQTSKCIIIPGIGNPLTDSDALDQYRFLYPEYVEHIYMVQMREVIAQWGGALNCLSWTRYFGFD